jgi:hyperosmotically inducible protein
VEGNDNEANDPQQDPQIQQAHDGGRSTRTGRGRGVFERHHEIRMYPRYSIFDNIGFFVDEGRVELLGEVSEPFKKADLGRIAQRVPGVTSMSNELKVLPVSPMDNRLRLQVARAIYRDPVLSRYSMDPVPPIHIIVDNGHVTLEGVVSTDMDKNVAGLRANGAGLSFGQVTNNLHVENPSHKS